jgi:hypothetical protein
MSFGTLGVDFIRYTNNGTGVTGSFSGLFNGQFPNMSTTGTLSGHYLTANSGAFVGTVTGATGSFNTVTGTTGNFGTINATSIPGYAVFSCAQTFSGGQRGLVNALAYSTGVAIDLNSGNNFQLTLTGNTTLQNPSNLVSGQAGILTIIQGSSGNTMAFGSNWRYPGGSGSVPSLTATSGAVDVLAYYVINSSTIAYRLVQDIKA